FAKLKSLVWIWIEWVLIGIVKNTLDFNYESFWNK
ncbi:MAG: hypothetical protein ACI9EK_001739, partial [Psychroserpens sp.]